MSVADETGNIRKPGRVWLVGAGPGDPELLTLAAARALAHADVILIDDLVNRAVLDHARPGVRVVPVGKRGGARKSQANTSQATIQQLMLDEARAGTAADASDLPKRGLTPQDLATAYGHQAVWDQGITGAGTEIAILQYGTETDDDLAVFDRQFGLSGPAPERIAVGDGLADREDFKAIYGDQGDENFVGFAGEAALDTQVVRAVAPGATILVYGTPIGGWVEGLDRIVRDGRARIVSICPGVDILIAS